MKNERMTDGMKIRDVDAVRQLYRGCYFPAEQTPHNFAEMTKLSERVDAALKDFFGACASGQRDRLEAILKDLGELDDLCSEDAFVKGFASAAELLGMKFRPTRRKRRKGGRTA